MAFRRLHLLAAIAFCLMMSSASGAEAWKGLKAGMTFAETTAALGQPLVKNHGRSFDLWIYDSGAEVVYLYGVVVAWTGPAGERTMAGRDIDLRPVLTPVVPAVAKAKAPEPVPEYDFREVERRTFRLPRL